MKKTIGRWAAALLAAAMLCGAALCGCTGEQTALSYGGVHVTKSMVAYWYASYKNQLLESYNGQDSDAYFDAMLTSGKSIGALFEERIAAMLKNNVASLYLFGQFGLALDSAEKNAVSQKLASEMQSAGGRAALNEKLGTMGLNISQYEKALLAEEKIAKLYTYLYGDADQGISGARTISQESYQRFYEENYVCVKQLLIRTQYKNRVGEDGYALTDENGKVLTEPLNEEEQAKKQEKVAQVQQKIDAGEDFDALMKEYNEDTGAKTYPQGYLVASFSGFDSTFTAAALGLQEIGDITRVETEAGVHFLKKCPLVEAPWNDSIYSTMLNRFRDYLESDDFASYTADVVANIRENTAVMNEFSVREVSIAFFRT